MKTFTYAIMHFVVAFSVSLILTGNLAISGMIAMIEPALQTIAYFFHEKMWNKYQLAQSG